MKTNYTTNEIEAEIALLKKQGGNLPHHLWVALAKNSLKQKSFGFTVVDVTPKGYGPTYEN